MLKQTIRQTHATVPINYRSDIYFPYNLWKHKTPTNAFQLPQHTRGEKAHIGLRCTQTRKTVILGPLGFPHQLDRPVVTLEGR